MVLPMGYGDDHNAGGGSWFPPDHPFDGMAPGRDPGGSGQLRLLIKLVKNRMPGKHSA